MDKIGIVAKHEIEYWEYLQDKAEKHFPEIFNNAFVKGRKALRKTFVHVGNLSQLRMGYTHAVILSYPTDLEEKIKKDVIKAMVA